MGNAINIDRVMNEWAWHKLAYELFYLDTAKDLDAYFDADDDSHDWWISKILNWRLFY